MENHHAQQEMHLHSGCIFHCYVSLPECSKPFFFEKMGHSPYHHGDRRSFWVASGKKTTYQVTLTFAFCAFGIQRAQIFRPQLLVLGWFLWDACGLGNPLGKGNPQLFSAPSPKKPPQKNRSTIKWFEFFLDGVEKKTSSNSKTPPNPLPIFWKPGELRPRETTIVPSPFFLRLVSARHMEIVTTSKKHVRITAIDVGLF